MTIHNLTRDANVLYASDSIVDILGYAPHEILGRSCFDYFHPDEVPFARSVHERGVLLDKAAVLKYARIISRDGRWVSCECCFTIVHDVLVACTSIYRRGEKSNRRALEAPQVRRLFTCSPRDPRYHMLEHLSPKFRTPAAAREPRAALIVNRFTRTLTVMFATEAISNILGVSAEHVKNKSFYECIQERSLDDAFKCLESAKANDSIAYLRFWSRDPRRPEDFADEESEYDDDEDGREDTILDDHRNQGQNGNTEPQDGTAQAGNAQRAEMPHVPPSRRSTDSEEEGGVKLDGHMDVDEAQQSTQQSAQQHPAQQSGPAIKVEQDVDMQDGGRSNDSGSSSDSQRTNSAAMLSSTHAAGYQTPLTPQSQRSVNGTSPDSERPGNGTRRRRLAPSVELEAVVSCTSDGLVVILRRARPQFPGANPPVPVSRDNGVFAAPWAQQPIYPHPAPADLHNHRAPRMGQGVASGEDLAAASGPPDDYLMKSIRDVAVFAWAVCGINGNLAAFGQGQPTGEAQPPEGLPVWDPDAAQTSDLGPDNQAAHRWTAMREEQHNNPNMWPGLYLGNQGHGGYGHGQQNPWTLQPSNFHNYRNHQAFAQNQYQTRQLYGQHQQMDSQQQMQFFGNHSQPEYDNGYNGNGHSNGHTYGNGELGEPRNNFYRWR